MPGLWKVSMDYREYLLKVQEGEQMTTIFSAGFLGRHAIDNEIRKFAEDYDGAGKILVDIGCGNMPYKKLFKKSRYIGVDIVGNVDIIAPAWKIPLESESIDLVLLTQCLEHIEKPKESVTEIKRLLKPKGAVFISAPMVMRVHSTKHDFWRFTKFGLLSLFKDFKVVMVKETNGYFATMFQMVNYFLKAVNIPLIFLPIYTLNNILAFSIEMLFSALGRIKGMKRFMELVYLTAPLNYVVVATK